jgi:hypothetical protein
MKEKSEISQCGVCLEYRRGSRFPSSERKKNGDTEYGNFVCDRYQQEARMLREVGAACDRQQRRRKAA